MKLSIFKPLAFACLSAGTLAAGAHTLAVGGPNAGVLAGNLNLNGTSYSNLEFGSASVSYDSGATQMTFCLEPQQDVSPYTTYTDYTQVTNVLGYFGSATTKTNLEKLFSEQNNLSNATLQAAFAMAVWEISWEKSGTYNLSSGTISFGGSTITSSGAMQIAQTWLNELPSVVDDYSLVIFDSPNEQDLVYGVKNPAVTPPISSAVPEPATYMMMAAGLLGIGVFGGRRDRKRT